MALERAQLINREWAAKEQRRDKEDENNCLLASHTEVERICYERQRVSEKLQCDCREHEGTIEALDSELKLLQEEVERRSAEELQGTHEVVVR